MKNSKQIKTEITQVQQWSGPLPAPESLAKYDNIIPGSAERILVMAEKEQNHRHQTENKTAKRQYVLVIVSVIFAFVCVIALVGLVFYAIYKGSDNSALAAIITAIAAVAGIFGVRKLLRVKEK